MIEQYRWMDWLLFFYIYSILGWVFESTYVSLKSHKFVNRGFLHGIFLPIYGSGAVMMLYVSAPFKDNLILTYFAGVVGATALEFVTGWAIETIFKVRYWDYSYQKYNYKGYICLSSSIAWGFFTIGMNEFLHPAIMKIIVKVDATAIHIFVGVVSGFLAIDMASSLKEAFDMRNMLVAIEDMRKEAALVRKRADVVIACVDDSLRGFVDSVPGVERIERAAKDLEERLIDIKKNSELYGKLDEKMREELSAIKQRGEVLRKKSVKIEALAPKMFYYRIKGNPTMESSKYSEALKLLKDTLRSKTTNN